MRIGMDKADLITYWQNSSDGDFKTMQNLFEKKDYHWSLFIGHLVIEKLLKAYYVKNVDNQPPFIHNLLRLAEKTHLKLTDDQKDFLVTVTTFNIRADTMIINWHFTKHVQNNLLKNGLTK